MIIIDPHLAAQWSGVSPSLVLDSRLAPLSSSSPTMFPLPHLAATCRGVMLCCKKYLENYKNIIVFVGWGRVLGLGSRSIQYVALLAYSAGSGPITPKFQ